MTERIVNQLVIKLKTWSIQLTRHLEVGTPAQILLHLLVPQAASGAYLPAFCIGYYVVLQTLVSSIDLVPRGFEAYDYRRQGFESQGH